MDMDASSDNSRSERIQLTPQIAAVIAAVLTLVGAVIGHFVSAINTTATINKDVNIKRIEVSNNFDLEKEKHAHQVKLEEQKFIRDIITKTLEKGTAEEQTRNLRAYAKISLIGSPYKEALLALNDSELPTISDQRLVVGRPTDGVTLKTLSKLQILSKAVGLLRIADSKRTTIGTGFLVSDRLFLTAGHNCGGKEEVQTAVVDFSYDESTADTTPSAHQFALDTDSVFVVNPELNYCLFALRPSSLRGAALSSLGFFKLSRQREMPTGEAISAIHHPLGKSKQVIVNGGEIFDSTTKEIRYGIFTAPGSAGAPILNANLEVVAIHLKFVPGGLNVNPAAYGGQELQKVAKEGVRASAVVEDLKRQAARMSAAAVPLVNALLQAP